MEDPNKIEALLKDESKMTPEQQSSHKTKRTRREVLKALGTWAAALSPFGLIAYLSSLSDDRNFQEAELEIVGLSSNTQKWTMNPARGDAYSTNHRSDPTYRFKLADSKKYTVDLRLPNGTINSREIPEDIFKELKEGDKIPCRYLIRYDGVQMVMNLLPRVKKK